MDRALARGRARGGAADGHRATGQVRRHGTRQRQVRGPQPSGPSSPSNLMISGSAWRRATVNHTSDHYGPAASSSLKQEAATRRIVTVILILIAALSFSFSFGRAGRG